MRLMKLSTMMLPVVVVVLLARSNMVANAGSNETGANNAEVADVGNDTPSTDLLSPTGGPSMLATAAAVAVLFGSLVGVPVGHCIVRGKLTYEGLPMFPFCFTTLFNVVAIVDSLSHWIMENDLFPALFNAFGLSLPAGLTMVVSYLFLFSVSNPRSAVVVAGPLPKTLADDMNDFVSVMDDGVMAKLLAAKTSFEQRKDKGSEEDKKRVSKTLAVIEELEKVNFESRVVSIKEAKEIPGVLKSICADAAKIIDAATDKFDYSSFEVSTAATPPVAGSQAPPVSTNPLASTKSGSDSAGSDDKTLPPPSTTTTIPPAPKASTTTPKDHIAKFVHANALAAIEKIFNFGIYSKKEFKALFKGVTYPDGIAALLDTKLPGTPQILLKLDDTKMINAQSFAHKIFLGLETTARTKAVVEAFGGDFKKHVEGLMAATLPVDKLLEIHDFVLDVQRYVAEKDNASSSHLKPVVEELAKEVSKKVANAVHVKLGNCEKSLKAFGIIYGIDQCKTTGKATAQKYATNVNEYVAEMLTPAKSTNFKAETAKVLLSKLSVYGEIKRSAVGFTESPNEALFPTTELAKKVQATPDPVEAERVVREVHRTESSDGSSHSEHTDTELEAPPTREANTLAAPLSSADTVESLTTKIGTATSKHQGIKKKLKKKNDEATVLNGEIELLKKNREELLKSNSEFAKLVETISAEYDENVAKYIAVRKEIVKAEQFLELHKSSDAAVKSSPEYKTSQDISSGKKKKIDALKLTVEAKQKGDKYMEDLASYSESKYQTPRDSFESIETPLLEKTAKLAELNVAINDLGASAKAEKDALDDLNSKLTAAKEAASKVVDSSTVAPAVKAKRTKTHDSKSGPTPKSVSNPSGKVTPAKAEDDTPK